MRFKFKYNEDDADCKRLKEQLHEQFVQLYGQGVRRFYVGGALGVDLWAGEILIRLKEQPGYDEIELIEVLPFEGYDAKWDAHSRKRMTNLLKHCTEIVKIGDPELSDAANDRRRNEYLVDHADCLLAVYDQERSIRSGTGMTVHYAQKKHLPIICIHPDTAEVSGLWHINDDK